MISLSSVNEQEFIKEPGHSQKNSEGALEGKREKKTFSSRVSHHPFIIQLRGSWC